VTAPESATLSAAYRECELITRQQAKNFFYGIALLPGPKRRALCAVYAFARRIDDIGDGAMAAADKITALEQARASVLALLCAAPDDADPVLVALWDAASRFPIPVSVFGELIDGCEADVFGARYATFGELEHYCRCVAGSIGRLSLGVFGSRDAAAAQPLADALGVALQITNILRDVREDLASGRVYLPAEDIERFGCVLDPGGDISGNLADLMWFEARRARQWYDTGLRLLPLLDRRSAACTGAMAGIYLRLLEHISAAPLAVLERRVSLPPAEKAAVAARALAGAARLWPAAAASPAGAWQGGRQ
jgi:phytoene synthase